MEHFLELLPSKDSNVPEKIAFTLEIKTYTRIFEYLIRKRLIEQFQWCLDHFESHLIDSEYLIHKMTQRFKDTAPKPEGLQETQLPKVQLQLEEYDILQRLFRLEKNYEKSFEFLIEMNSAKVFDYFSDRLLQGLDQNKMLYGYLTKLLNIDAKQTLFHLLKQVNSDSDKKKVVNRCVALLDHERKDKIEKTPDEREALDRKYDRLLSKLFEQVFTTNQDLIDDAQHFARLFNLMLAHNPNQLMPLMQKTGKWPIDAEKLCERNGLFVEQAYILLEKKQFDDALQILLRKLKSSEMEKGLNLAMRFNFIDRFIEGLIERANQNTDQVNTLLEYVDYLSNPEKLIEQYG